MDEGSFGVFGALDRNFGAANMMSSDLRLTDSAAATAGSHFFPRLYPGMDYGGADAAVFVASWMMCHPLFDVATPCHCMFSGFLDSAKPGHLDTVGGSIRCKCSLWQRLSLM